MKKTIQIFIFIVFSQFSSFSQNNNAEIVKYTTTYTISESITLTKEVNVSILINNKTGENLTKISIPYSKKNPIVELNGQITDIFGKKIRKLKNKDIEIKSHISDISLYEDNFIKTFTLKHNVYPYIISYNYKINNNSFFYIASWSPYFKYKTSTKNAILKIIIPENYKIKIDQNNIKKPKIERINKKISYTWNSNYKFNYKYNIYAPEKDKEIPSVKIVPFDFKYSTKGNQKTWKDFGNWVYKLNEGLDFLPTNEKIKIDELIKDKKTEIEKIDALYKYMQQNTRYINVSIDVGGFKPYPASYVSENKYGDCKALSNYMKAILKHAGITSYYCLINAGDSFKEINKDFISAQFNHAILCVPNNNDTSWLECTNNYIPTGYMGTFTQGRNALLIKKNESKLINTPKLNIEDVIKSRTIEFSIKDNKTVLAKVNLNLKGDEYESFISFNETLSTVQKEKYIHRFIPFNNYELINWNINSSKKEASINFNAELELKNYIKTYEDMKYLALYPTKIPNFEKPKNRTKDIVLNYPINIIDTLIYKNINGYKFETRKNTSIISKYGSYKIKSQIEADKITITKQFILFAGKYKLSEYKPFYNFLSSIKMIERKTPIIYIKEK